MINLNKKVVFPDDIVETLNASAATGTGTLVLMQLTSGGAKPELLTNPLK